jgi:tRNA G10  N-methylase Trm11
MSHFLVFGTHPRLSLAEYRAVRPSLNDAPRLMANGAVVDDPEWDGAGLMNRLGGTVKLGDILISEKLTEINAERIAALCKEHPRGNNISFGFSVIGGTPGAHRTLERLPLHVKRALAARDVKSRWVTSKDSPSLSPAAVAKLKLTTEGYDFVLLVEGDHAHIGLTTHVQDADAWSLRDYGRPARDDEAGMLPPKLARMMVNLARVDTNSTLLDPFCGSGTVLMEAAMMTDTARIIGSDVDPKQVADTNMNTEWLIEKGILKPADKKRVTAFVDDVKSLGSKLDPLSVDRVVTEGNLGPPLRGSEPQKVLDKNRDTISELWRTSLTALTPLLKPGARLVIVWPSFKTANALSRVKLDDECAGLGYRVTNPLAGWDDTDAPLIYHREGQKVARRIVVLERLP